MHDEVYYCIREGVELIISVGVCSENFPLQYSTEYCMYVCITADVRDDVLQVQYL